MTFSVLMSVYGKADADALAASLESLATQTLKASEVVLVEDGPLTPKLDEIIADFRERLPLKSVKLHENKGLAAALNAGLKVVSHEWVARMDADDICLPTRFARQMDYLRDHPDIDVLGTWIEERDTAMAEVLAVRKTPQTHDAILRFAQKRSPVSHPSVFFRKDAVEAVGGYPDLYPEDYLLWGRLLAQGYRFANLPEILVWMRTEDDFYARRGWRFFKGEVASYIALWRLGFLPFHRCLLNSITRAILRLSPAFLKRIMYQRLR